MERKEVVGWFTLPNGKHVPIFQGESKMGALGRHINEKRKEKVKDRADYLKKTLATPGLEQNNEEFEKMAQEDLKNERPKIKGIKSNKPSWDGKNKEVEVKFWRGNPQLKNGGYETTRNYTARTENGLMKQIRKTENAGVYGTMSYRSYKEKAKQYKLKSPKMVTQAKFDTYQDYVNYMKKNDLKFQRDVISLTAKKDKWVLLHENNKPIKRK